mgnify:FL=1
MPAALEGKDRKPFKLSQKAGYLCNDPAFRQFIEYYCGRPFPDVATAAQWVREMCGVTSRSMLDSNPAAAQTFNNILSEYDSWKRAGENPV